MHARVGGPAQLLRELVGVHVQVEPDRRERDAPPQVVGLRRRGGRRLLARPQQGPLGAVDDVALGDAHVAAEHELLLDDVLDRLDRDVQQPEPPGALVDARGEPGRGRRIVLERQEGGADGDLDLARIPRRDVAVAADEARRVRRRRQRRGHAVEHERAGDVVLAGVDEDRLDDRREVVDGDPPGVVQPPRDRGGGRADRAAGGGRVGLRPRRARARAPTARRRRHRPRARRSAGRRRRAGRRASRPPARRSRRRRAAPRAAAPPRA